MSKQRKSSSIPFSASIFSSSFFATLIIIVVIGALMLIVYRVETTLNIDPIVIFTLTDHSNGDFSFTFLNFKGTFSLRWLYEIRNNLLLGELLLPQSSRIISQNVSNASDCVAYLIDKMVLHLH